VTPRISGPRLLADIAQLATFGGRPDGGVDRVAGSPADLAARAWLADRLRVEGLRTWTDDTGNVFGSADGGTGRWLLIGSHSDTVPAGGRLDGAYGVVAALEVLRTLHQSRHPAGDTLQIVSFWDEEGARPDSTGGLVGSTALCRSPHIEQIGAFLELHIEQGPRMVEAGLELAVVTGVVGITRYAVTVRGQANHAGTTPMDRRRDAGRAAARVAVQVADLARRIDHTMVANVGSIQLLPGAPNVIPGQARVAVEFRATSEAALDTAADELQSLVRRSADSESCTATVDRLARHAVTTFDPELCDLLDRVCHQTGRPTGRLTSYAGHDAAVLAQRVPAAMLFVPSTDGVSHAPREHTPEPLLMQGCQALLDAVVAYPGR
jgi:beta-ureidopropionase / N-carbamoyl-L-amino-acid hydrolase